MEGLVADAIPGTFNVRMWGGRFRCEVVRDILEGEVSSDDCEALVREVAANTLRHGGATPTAEG